MEVKNFTLSIVVMNRPGVLSRVVGLFTKRGYNIDSLYVSALAEDNSMSRIIMTSSGNDAIREQIIKQLEKLFDVQEAKLI
ncbi:MAG: acetolactate synthase small subunit [Oscillospiraceae bacterium]|jgi:acetolactate synthase-1/3 small subunit|nr:acetolactate synthase small subunit [Oscillospiraceae bacterium]